MDKAIAVKINSQSQLNDFCAYIKPNVNLSDYEYYKNYKYSRSGSRIFCIRLNKEVSWDQSSYFEEMGLTVISFEEFERDYLKKTPEKTTSPELIPGKWYKITSGKSILNDLYYVKYKEINKEGTIKSEEYIGGCGRTEYAKGISFGWGEMNTYIWTLLENLEEIQQWLPEGHVDKIKPMETKNPLKREDFGYVECITNHDGQFTKGKVYKLRKPIKNEHVSVVKDDVGDENGMSEKWFKLSTKEAYDKQQNDTIVIKEEVKMADKQEEHPIIGEYYTVLDPRYEGKMIGKVISTNENSDNNHTRGKATFLSIFEKKREFITNSPWSYKNREGRNFKPSTPNEIKWLEACIEANKFVSEEEALKSKDMELEPNKWYTLEQEGGWGKWLILIDRLEGNNIFYKKYHHFKDGAHASQGPGIWGYTSNIEKGSVKLADVEEVYKYFPEEKSKETPKKHPLEGRYLKVIHDNGITHYPCHVGDVLKFVKVEGNAEYWGHGGEKSGKEPWYWGTRAHEEHYFKLMPEGWTPETDKPKVMDEKWIPKVGDYCIYQDKDMYRIKSLDSENCILEYIKVKGRTLGDTISYETIHFSDPGIWRKALSHEIPGNMEKEEFKAGDWIVFNNNGGKLGGNIPLKLGIAYKIESLDKPFQSAGDCNAVLSGGVGVRLSTIDKYDKGRYEAYFRKATFEEIPGNTPKEKSMEEENNWCVKLTPENKQAIIDYSIKVGNTMSGTTSYYGFMKSSCFTASSYPWGKELTTEKFYQKIGISASKPSITESDDWCVKCTAENLEILREWQKSKGFNLSMNIDAWYGWKFSNVHYGSWDGRWGKILTTEEFYRKIGKSAPIKENSNDALLEEAKRKYPIGTIYQALNSHGVTYGDTKESYRIASFIEDCNGKKMGIDVGYGYVYVFENNRWAEIVSSPNVGVYEQLPSKINIELYKPKQNTQINENVTKITSISSQLVKPKKVVLF